MSFLPTRTPGGKPLILRQLLTSKFPTPPRHTHKIQTSIKGHKAGTVGSAPSTAAFGKRLNYNFLFLGQCWEELRGFRNGFLNHKGDARPLRGKEVARCSLPKYINPKYTNQNVTLQNISPGPICGAGWEDGELGRDQGSHLPPLPGAGQAVGSPNPVPLSWDSAS